ncbi:hypothetical protein G6O69_22510 [Pseudenhygromyxa sp. WMMC2535]|uniref:hypothetical protein n=1 Tax=Pseudenhygromyxa sp. WMMC2535 TaxID=2712867 RepID=UPI0015534628|nr:hypothetical protein [Pseudenhygromyxa sp. WMMC2535]NVB40628.1 hypothetical protein [Pseudenhygromyxa sp. WMMC2535]
MREHEATFATALRAGDRAASRALCASPIRLRRDNLVERPWGGRALLRYKGLDADAGETRYGEAFEVAADPSDPEAAAHPSTVVFADGSSMPLPELLGLVGAELLGAELFAAHGPRLPLLPKTLDVAALLSVQTHPPASPEVYVVIEREPGATLRLGFRERVDGEALAAELLAGRQGQQALLELLDPQVDPRALQASLAAGLSGPVDALVDALAPQLRRAEDRPRLGERLGELVALVHRTLGRLNALPVEPGQVIFNANPPQAISASTPSAEVHALGNLEGRSMLVLEVRRPGPTFRAWDHLRFPMRELAIEQAISTMNLEASDPADFVVAPRAIPGRPGAWRSIACPAFVVEHLRPTPSQRVAVARPDSVSTLHVLRGRVAVVLEGESEPWGSAGAGESLLLPAQLGAAMLCFEAGGDEGEGDGDDDGEGRGEVEVLQVWIPGAGELDAANPEAAGGAPAGDETRGVEEASAQAKTPRARADDDDDGEREGAKAGLWRNLAALRELAPRCAGPAQVLAIVNSGDGPAIAERFAALSPALFCADGSCEIFVHEERTRRGQLLGLLDAHRAHHAEGALDRDRVALGIMLPGKGTRLSPLTQRLHGIKPLLPVPLRIRGPHGPIRLEGATASLWTWTLIAHTLERLGFRGVAWKWGDEPQIAARALAALDRDLSQVDALRFGASSPITEELARNKEWLHVDPQTGDLITQLRRRPRAELLARLGLDPDSSDAARAHVHTGSPAFSHLFLRHAEAVFADCSGWLDVDGYLFEALTHEPAAWAAERARDPALRALLERCPDFYERVRMLRGRIEAERGHPLRIAAIDLGEGLYWGDIGQLAQARAVYASLVDPGARGDFARALALLDDPAEVRRDRFGNWIAGDSRVPEDGSVRDCVIVDSVLGRGQALRAVVVRSKLERFLLAPGAVAVDSAAVGLRLDERAMAFASYLGAGGDSADRAYLRVPADHVHTSIPADPRAEPPALESWFCDARVDPGSGARYEEPGWGNPESFADKFAQVRQREVPPAAVEARIAKVAKVVRPVADERGER